jgi:hypothetical protein
MPEVFTLYSWSSPSLTWGCLLYNLVLCLRVLSVVPIRLWQVFLCVCSPGASVFCGKVWLLTFSSSGHSLLDSSYSGFIAIFGLQYLPANSNTITVWWGTGKYPTNVCWRDAWVKQWQINKLGFCKCQDPTPALLWLAPSWNNYPDTLIPERSSSQEFIT